MRYVIGEPIRVRNGDALMRLADDVRRSVVFLGCVDLSDPDRLDPIFGTAFFVGWGGACYLVTAGHVADLLKADPTDEETGPFGIRLNDASGSGHVLYQDSVRFWYHRDYPQIDVAVMELVPPLWSDVICIPQSIFMSERVQEIKDIGPGDLAYVVGLFQMLPGTAKNLPIVHTGHLASYPGEERIPLEDGGYLLGYLVEANAIRGASGSPVFVRRTLHSIGETWDSPSGRQDEYYCGAAFVLGLWAGSWNERIGGNQREMTRGVGIVTPAISIIEALEMPELKNKRAQRKAELDRERGATLSRAVASKADGTVSDGNSHHKEDFTRLLNAAARKREQEPGT